jgi:hypothetical protein
MPHIQVGVVEVLRPEQHSRVMGVIQALAPVGMLPAMQRSDRPWSNVLHARQQSDRRHTKKRPPAGGRFARRGSFEGTG